MENIFGVEDSVILKGQLLLESGGFTTSNDAQKYEELLGEYQKMLRQQIKLVKVSDLMQLEQKKLSERLEAMSNLDVLTGLFNRRFFNDVFQKEWESAVRNKTPLSIIMVDIDYFKRYNDAYGHLQGDECLKSVALAIESTVKRPRDVVTRFGGEEFVILLPETDAHGALRVADEIVGNVEALGLLHSESQLKGIVTVSAGVSSSFPDQGCGGDHLLRVMDNALYLAKDEGRNCARLIIAS